MRISPGTAASRPPPRGPARSSGSLAAPGSLSSPSPAPASPACACAGRGAGAGACVDTAPGVGVAPGAAQPSNNNTAPSSPHSAADAARAPSSPMRTRRGFSGARLEQRVTITRVSRARRRAAARTLSQRRRGAYRFSSALLTLASRSAVSARAAPPRAPARRETRSTPAARSARRGRGRLCSATRNRSSRVYRCSHLYKTRPHRRACAHTP